MKRCSPAVDVLIGTWQASRLLLYRYKGGGVKFSTEVLLYLVAVLIILSFIAALVAWVSYSLRLYIAHWRRLIGIVCLGAVWLRES